MKTKIIERYHELDLQDAVNEFLQENPIIHTIQYQVAMTSKEQLEYSFSVFILYDDKINPE